jgi:hypothetical protein
LPGAIEKAASDSGTEYALLLRIGVEGQALAREFDGICGGESLWNTVVRPRLESLSAEFYYG